MRYFPLFLDLNDRPVLVVGGGPVAERKTALLCAAGARVTVVAPELTAGLEAAVRAESLRHRRGTFSESDVEGCALVIAATGDRDVNARAAAAARARNIPVNVVDDPELSSFIVPSIIDRSPVQIAVSTGGASPVLARLLRERLEALLDESLGALAEFAAGWRQRLKHALPSVGERRRFIRWMLEGPVAAALRGGRREAAEALVAEALAREERAASIALDDVANLDGAGPFDGVGHLDDVARLDGVARPGNVSHLNNVVRLDDVGRLGSVALVGAGPGDPGLLTLQALRRLQEADVILHDRLVSPAVLELARRDAARESVGKQPGGGGASQDAINRRMVALAREGLRVVRLKGGDPLVFGRGGEELAFLHEAGIPYEVVPGITAAFACAAYAAIPLTDRRFARVVSFATAHDEAALDSIDWSTIAGEGRTLALYMGVGTLPGLVRRLLAGGVDARTPAVLVENGSLPTQRVVIAVLQTLAEAASVHAVRAPALTIVGAAAVEAARLHWFGVEPILYAPGLRVETESATLAGP